RVRVSSWPVVNIVPLSSGVVVGPEVDELVGGEVLGALGGRRAAGREHPGRHEGDQQVLVLRAGGVRAVGDARRASGEMRHGASPESGGGRAHHCCSGKPPSSGANMLGQSRTRSKRKWLRS